jgi:uncharacterized protein (DUF608 family)
MSEYTEYKNKYGDYWNLRKELIKYCELDCKSLHEILFKFSHQIYSDPNLWMKKIFLNYPEKLLLI